MTRRRTRKASMSYLMLGREIRRPPRRRLMQIRRRFSGRAIVLWAAFYGVFVGNVLAPA
jgi:hypothetical protein